MFLRKTYLALAISTVASLSFLSSAMAGGFDEPRYNDYDTSNWSGLYIGLHAGYGWTDVGTAYDFGALNDTLFNDAGLASGIESSVDGYVVGGQIGFQKQIGRWVIGVEGTASATGIDGSAGASWSFDDISCPFGCFGVAGEGTQTLRVQLDNLYTATGRIGFTQGDWLAYIKGGYATADIDVSSDIGGEVTGCFFGCVTFPVTTSGNSEKRHDGWVIGGGIEHMLARNVTLGVEYNYIDLGSRTHSIDTPIDIADFIELPGGYKTRIDPDAIQTVSVRLNFLLNGPAPIAPVPLK